MTHPITVSAVQITALDGMKDTTVEKMMRLIDVAGQRGSELVVLPEVWTGLGYSSKMAHRSIAEEIPGPTTDLLAEKAKRYGMTIIGSIYEKAGERYYNSSPVIGPDGRIVGKYWKTHLFDAPNRTRHSVRHAGVRSGQRRETSCPSSDGGRAGRRVGVLRSALPRGVSRVGSERGQGDRLRFGFPLPRFDHWEFLLRARATENQCWVVASGQVGIEPKIPDCLCRPQHDRRSMGRHRSHGT